jgi:hypothetical protein
MLQHGDDAGLIQQCVHMEIRSQRGADGQIIHGVMLKVELNCKDFLLMQMEGLRCKDP